MNRRHFLGTVLATCTAPAIVRAASLMPTVRRASGIWTAEELARFAAQSAEDVIMDDITHRFEKAIAGTVIGRVLIPRALNAVVTPWDHTGLFGTADQTPFRTELYGFTSDGLLLPLRGKGT